MHCSVVFGTTLRLLVINISLSFLLSILPTCHLLPAISVTTWGRTVVRLRRIDNNWLPDGEKISQICLFVLTECTNMTDTHTQTPHDGIGCACIARRSKNDKICNERNRPSRCYILRQTCLEYQNGASNCQSLRCQTQNYNINKLNDSKQADHKIGFTAFPRILCNRWKPQKEIVLDSVHSFIIANGSRMHKFNQKANYRCR